jgi:hypothetical protein
MNGVLSKLRNKGRYLLSSELTQFIRGTATVAAATKTKPVLEKEFMVYRWNPDSSENPRYQSYKVDINS